MLKKLFTNNVKLHNQFYKTKNVKVFSSASDAVDEEAEPKFLEMVNGYFDMAAGFT